MFWDRSKGAFPKLQSLFLVREDPKVVSKGDVELVDLTDERELDDHCRGWNRIAKFCRTAPPRLIFKSMVPGSSS
jgi:hypothetical protein